MAFDWIYGDRTHETGFGPMRNLLLDIETLPDLAKHLETIIQKEAHVPEGAEHWMVTSYDLQGREVKAAELAGLGVPDRNRLVMSTGLRYRPATPYDVAFGPPGYGVIVRCDIAQIELLGPVGDDGAFAERLRVAAIEYLYLNGSIKVDWWRIRALTIFVPFLLALACWWWLVIGYGLPVPASLLILGGIGAAVAPTLRWLRLKNSSRSFPSHAIRFRGESRATTYGRRADHRRDLLIVGITFASTLAVAVVGAAATGFFTYLFAT